MIQLGTDSLRVLGGRLLIIMLEQGTDHIHSHLFKASRVGRGSNFQKTFPPRVPVVQAGICLVEYYTGPWAEYIA